MQTDRPPVRQTEGVIGAINSSRRGGGGEQKGPVCPGLGTLRPPWLPVKQQIPPLTVCVFSTLTLLSAACPSTRPATPQPALSPTLCSLFPLAYLNDPSSLISFYRSLPLSHTLSILLLSHSLSYHSPTLFILIHPSFFLFPHPLFLAFSLLLS